MGRILNWTIGIPTTLIAVGSCFATYHGLEKDTCGIRYPEKRMSAHAKRAYGSMDDALQALAAEISNPPLFSIASGVGKVISFVPAAVTWGIAGLGEWALDKNPPDPNDTEHQRCTSSLDSVKGFQLATVITGGGPLPEPASRQDTNFGPIDNYGQAAKLTA